MFIKHRVKNMATIKEISEAVGVSTATVSRVLSGSANVKQSTKEKVLQQVDLLNYQPNVLARQFRQQKTFCIHVIVPNITNPFYREIFFGIEKVVQEHNYQVYFIDIQNDKEIPTKYLNFIDQKQTDGIISLSVTVAKSVLEKYFQNSPLVIACQYIENENTPNVTIDNIGAAEKAILRLLELGHQQIAILSGPEDHVIYRERIKGCKKAFEGYHVRYPSELESFGKNTLESGYKRTLELLEDRKDITAIFALGDEMAVGAIRAIKENGLSVPSDVSVIGFDGIEIGGYLDPQLTTIRQPMFEIGCSAARLLFNIIDNEKPATPKIVLDYEFFEGGTIAPLKE